MSIALLFSLVSLFVMDVSASDPQPQTAIAAPAVPVSTSREEPALDAPSEDSTGASLADGQREPSLQPDALLQLALRAAGSLPVEPHVKSRSRQQELVVDAWLSLDQPDRALAAAEQIANWRRGAALADYARYMARRGVPAEDLQPVLDRAEIMAEQAIHEGAGQRWRGDRVRAKLAQASVWLGQDEQLTDLSAGLEGAELGSVTATLAERLLPLELDGELRRLDAAIHGEVFDQVRGALATGVSLYARFFDEASLRARVLETLTPARKSVSRQVWIEWLHELCDVALAHDDSSSALALLDQAEAVANDVSWLPEHRVALLASMARRRALAGDAERAAEMTRQALQLYQIERAGIIDIYRCETLLPLAEAYAAMGRRDDALTTYSAALLESQRNPNGRPRVEDLVALCCSMALKRFDPGNELSRKITRAVEALASPW